MLDQKRVAEQLEQVGPVSGSSSYPREFSRERLDGVEHVGDLPFVVRQHDALGERVGDDQKPFQRHLAHQNRAARRDQFFGFLGNLDFRPLLLGRSDGAEGARLQALEEIGFLLGREADEHHNAVAKHHGQSVFSDPHRERRAGEDLPLEAGCVNAIADQEGVRRELRGVGIWVRHPLLLDALASMRCPSHAAFGFGL